MKKLAIITALLTGITCLAALRDGSSSGGGGGIAEKNLIFAHQNLKTYVAACLVSSSCRLNAQEQKILNEISDGLKKEGTAEKQLVFTSAAERPGFFTLDGFERIARTGCAAGDPIYINRSLAYQTGKDHKTNALSLGGSVALLVHEMGHHHGVADHAVLDALGSKVESLMLASSQSIDGELSGEAGRMTVFYPPEYNGEGTPGFSQILVPDRDGIHDVTAAIFGQVKCPEQGSRSRAALVGADLSNIHFAGPMRNLDDSSDVVTIQGRLLLKCQDNGGTTTFGHAGDLKLYLQLEGLASDGSYRLGTVKAEQISCDDEPGACH